MKRIITEKIQGKLEDCLIVLEEKIEVEKVTQIAMHVINIDKGIYNLEVSYGKDD